MGIRNPKAGIIEREKAIREIGEIIKGRLVADPNGSGDQKMYVSDSDREKLEKQAQEQEQSSATPQTPATPRFNRHSGNRMAESSRISPRS